MSARGLVLERRQEVPGDLVHVFAFFKDPHNLARITPPWLRFQVAHTTDATVRRGTRIRYDIKWFGLPMRWESLISEYRENERFSDEMLIGPYARWYHTHTFEQLDGGVEMRDRVEYALPLGPLGRVAHAVMVARQLRAIFDYREVRIREIFPGR
jgi:ligand-binding SRPBCC domain-containing protein